jgi:peptidoglycan/xylan/chitin deacetylase (PgdA/CDA1 family)
MRVRGLGTARRVARRVRRWRQPRALILLYHRVYDVPIDPFSLAVTPEHFQEHLDVLGAMTRPIRLGELVRGMRDGTLPDRSVAVTFDDGYADNLTVARSLLHQRRVPATVFIATGQLDGHREFWWDELERLVLELGTLSGFAVRINEKTFQWDLGETDARSPSTRQQIYCALHGEIRPLPAAEREAVLTELRTQAGTSATVRPTHRTLRPEEIGDLVDGGLMEVGAHTESHPVLAALSPCAQAQEIRRSKASLENILGREVSSFTYPYGGRQDYTATTVAAVRDAGFDYACSARAGLVSPGMDRYQLARRVVTDCNGDAFARRLEEWFDA